MKRYLRIAMGSPYWSSAELLCMLPPFMCRKRTRDSIDTLERRICGEFAVKYSVATDLGRQSLTLALASLGVSKGDGIILPSFVCQNVILPILRLNCVPQFVDIGKDMNISPESVEKVLNHKTRAIIVPHLYGQAAPIQEVLKIARSRSVAVIDDAAKAIGSKLGGQYVGTFGDLGIFSFGPFKSIMATRGGALITNSEKTYQNIRRFLPLPNSTEKMCVRALKSLVKFKLRRYSYWILPSNRRSEKVEEEQIEDNLAELKPMRMSPMDAAIVQAQLDKLERIVSRRIMLARHLSELLKECEWLEIPRERGDANVFVKYLIYLKTNSEVNSGLRGKMASELIAHLRRLGIEAHSAYAPLHLNEHYSGYSNTQLSVTEDVWKRLVCLPINPEMSTSDLEFMASSIIGFGLRR